MADTATQKPEQGKAYLFSEDSASRLRAAVQQRPDHFRQTHGLELFSSRSRPGEVNDVYYFGDTEIEITDAIDMVIERPYAPQGVSDDQRHAEFRAMLQLEGIL
ncbi:MAG: hypothetical protein ABIH92_04775 [Nanoarchaeota archaeon]